ncbi:putative aspartic peptidase A1 family [Helianthus annuus]|uniref:Aspartic peptidase A1 family n=1 Tax=Helianthus annuus TaxID=4232 RepID=A0A251SFW7_HELAN|nr:putative aspartic peptidase A1 family [Helianthus annuus]KAJ0839617.1 putative aspartic peptidase A1 family [Helianthus annuus]
MEQLMAYNQGGTVKDYCDLFQILFDQVINLEEISEFYAIYLFICGLEPKIGKILARWHQYSCTKVKDVISLALKIDSNGLQDSFSPFDPNSSFYNKELEFDINVTLEELMKDNEFFKNGKIQEVDIVQETTDDEVFDESVVFVHKSGFGFKVFDINDSMENEMVIDRDVLRENGKDNKIAPKVFDEMLGRFKNEIREMNCESDNGNDIQAKESFDCDLLFDEMSKYVGNVIIEDRGDVSTKGFEENKKGSSWKTVINKIKVRKKGHEKLPEVLYLRHVVLNLVVNKEVESCLASNDVKVAVNKGTNTKHWYKNEGANRWLVQSRWKKKVQQLAKMSSQLLVTFRVDEAFVELFTESAFVVIFYNDNTSVKLGVCHQKMIAFLHNVIDKNLNDFEVLCWGATTCVVKRCLNEKEANLPCECVNLIHTFAHFEEFKYKLRKGRKLYSQVQEVEDNIRVFCSFRLLDKLEVVYVIAFLLAKYKDVEIYLVSSKVVEINKNLGTEDSAVDSFFMCFGYVGTGRICSGHIKYQEVTPLKENSSHLIDNITVTQLRVGSSLSDSSFTGPFNSGSWPPADQRIPFEYCHDMSHDALFKGSMREFSSAIDLRVSSLINLVELSKGSVPNRDVTVWVRDPGSRIQILGISFKCELLRTKVFEGERLCRGGGGEVWSIYQRVIVGTVMQMVQWTRKELLDLFFECFLGQHCNGVATRITKCSRSLVFTVGIKHRHLFFILVNSGSLIIILTFEVNSLLRGEYSYGSK